MPIEDLFKREKQPPPILEVREYHNAGDKTVADIGNELRASGEPLAGVKEAEWVKKNADTPEFRNYIARYQNGDQYVFFGEGYSCTLRWIGDKFKLHTFSGIMSPNGSAWDSQRVDPNSPRRRYVVRVV